MKHSLHQNLVCPKDEKALKLFIFEEQLNEIKEGLLRCECCGADYPIINFVPRFVGIAQSKATSFIQRWSSKAKDEFKIELFGSNISQVLGKEYQQVATHFSEQWKKFGEKERAFGRDIDGSLQFLLDNMTPPGSSTDFFSGKKVLDAGCGHGKYLVRMSELAMEVYGMDITDSVDLCQRLVGEKPNVHIVQADVIHPPFKRKFFDYIFSEGVVHHTPNTRAAFDSLAARVVDGGCFSVWVYPHRASWYDVLQKNLRSITTRLHPKILMALCYIPVPLLSIKSIGAYSGTNLSNSSWSECAQVVFDFYGPKYQTHHSEEELTEWFKAAGYQNVQFGPNELSATAERTPVKTISVHQESQRPKSPPSQQAV